MATSGTQLPLASSSFSTSLFVVAILLLKCHFSTGQRLAPLPQPPALPLPPGSFQYDPYAPLPLVGGYGRQEFAEAPRLITRRQGEPFVALDWAERVMLQDQGGATSELIMPYEGFTLNGTRGQPVYNVIENKRFVEAVQSRCWASTALEDPKLVEPSFVIIRPQSEVRLNATASPALIQMAHYDPKLNTKIMVHGFTQSYPSTAWLRRTRALFERHRALESHNLIIMDWGAASQGSYTQVAGMASGMGSFLANFLMKLLELGTDRSRIHIIGHSLGAHVAGFAGKRIKPRIGRITALDPAGPCFGKFFSNSPQDRLEAADAYEVDVYHFDDSFLGLPGQHGHFDVYVNGGSSQPGCANNMNAMFQALITIVTRRDRVLSESHTRSTEVITTDLASLNCQQVAYECRDYGAFTRGECGLCDDYNSQCFLMGFEHQYTGTGPGGHHQPDFPLRQAPGPAGAGKRLFIMTLPQEPFCTQHYQILAKFEPSPEMSQAAKRNKWRLHLDLLTDRAGGLNVTLSHQMAPNVFSHLLLTEAPPFRVVGAQLQVRTSDGGSVPLSPASKPGSASVLWPFALEINFMSNMDPNVRRVLSSRLCPMGPSPLSAPANQVPGADTSGRLQQPNWIRFDECLAPPQGR